MARKLRDLMESLPPERRAEIEKRSAEIRREIEAREKAVGLFCLKHEYIFPEGAPHSCPHCEANQEESKIIERCATVAEKVPGYVSCDESFSRGYDAGRHDAAKEIRDLKK